MKKNLTKPERAWRSNIRRRFRFKRETERIGGEKGRKAMDEQEFRSILNLFPVVRSRDHRVSLSSLFLRENSFVLIIVAASATVSLFVKP